MWKAFFLTGLIFTQLGCAVQKKQTAVQDGRQLKARMVLIKNESSLPLYYRYTRFKEWENQESQREQTLSTTLSFQAHDLTLEPGQNARLKVFPDSEVVLHYGEKDIHQTFKITEDVTLIFKGETVDKNLGTPDFTQ